jgi:3-deoxy-D-arabino-heptulosonate 7-phosphate (DAHP) synthase
MMSPTPKSPARLLIAGPCSAEGEEQIMSSLAEAQQRPVDYVRISLWKPRTQPGFDGIKESGIPLMAKAATMGLNPATEVLTPEQAETVVTGVLPSLCDDGRMMLWVGARNQNHLSQQEIARVAAQDSRITVMFKNQPWYSESHWEGIASHALEGGVAAENLILCHRGFTPGKHEPNPGKLRNIADSEMAMRVKAATGVRVILDISHIAGSVDNIEPVALAHMQYDYDGMIIEVHPNPRFAWTDAKQQITWKELDTLLEKLDKQAKNRQAAVLTEKVAMA